MKIGRLFAMAVVVILCIQQISCSNADKRKKEETKVAFPIPFLDGEEVLTNTWNGKSGLLTLSYKADRYKELIAFYDKYTKSGDWKRTETGKGSLPSVIYMNLSKGLTIDLGPPEGQVSDAVLVTLYVTE